MGVDLNRMKKREIYIAGDNVITSLGFSTTETIRKIKNNLNGFKLNKDNTISRLPVPLALVDTHQLDELFTRTLEICHPDRPGDNYTRLEKLLILSLFETLQEFPEEIYGPKTILILSTTKGNIDLLEPEKKAQYEPERVTLWRLGEVIRKFFGFSNTPVIVSNACISGVLSLSLGSRLLSSGLYDNAVVTGGDIISEFVVSGFTSFQALSAEPCKPFDISRNGLSLGEGCGTLVLTTSPDKFSTSHISISGSAITNDANHISGPSRTGEELGLAITRSIEESELMPRDIHFISAHGTGTLYNDEMESKAIVYAGLQEVPLNSFKGYLGHTLGGAGLIESVLTLRSAVDNFLYRSAGYTSPGVPEKIHVLDQHLPVKTDHCLKIASGFGGCNAAIVFRKNKK